MLVCSVCLSVCLFVAKNRVTNSFQAIVLKKFFMCVGDRPRTATLNLGEDLNPDPDLRIFPVILHH